MSTDTKTIKFKFAQGIMRESTQFAAEGGWYDGNRVRFRDGKPENIRGWQKHDTDSFIGTSRAIHSWSSLDNQKLVAFATEHKVYLYQGGSFYDITPIQSSATNATGNTSSGSAQVVVTATSHGLEVDKKTYVVFNSATGVIGGNVSLSGNEYLVSVIDANSFAVTYTSTADATSASAGAFGIDFLLQSGTSIGTGGFGWGAGPYGDSTYGTARSTSNITIDMRQWSMDNFGEDLLINPAHQGKVYKWVEDNGFSTRAVYVTATPTASNNILVSPIDRHVVCLGCNDITGTFDPLLVRWSNQEDLNNWTPSVSSTSGSIRLGNGTEIVGGLMSRTTILAFTDKSLHSLEFIGPPFIFRTKQVADSCGLIAKHAAAIFDGRTMWMSNGNFFVHDGGSVKVLPCTVLKYVFDDLNITQKDKIFAGVNSEFGEVTWLYPSSSSDECDRYVTYSPSENYWTFGESIWTSWMDRSVFDNMMTTGVSAPDTVSYLYDNEPSNIYTADGTKLQSYIESGVFDLGDGDDILFIDRIIPDFTIKNGNVEVIVKTQNFPNATTVSKGPYTILSSTNFIRTRSRGRQGVLRIQTSAINTQWQLGTVRMDVMMDGKR